MLIRISMLRQRGAGAGFGPEPRNCTNLPSMSNQNGAPNTAATAVI